MDNLSAAIEKAIGRPFEVEKTQDGSYIVLFLAFEKLPPPKGKTPEEAMEKFLEWHKSMPQGEADES